MANEPYVEKVAVPSSQHIAEIVGRKSWKIKSLQNRTDTIIKVSPRGEAPLFLICGSPLDVINAKHEVLDAAAHITLRELLKNDAMKKEYGLKQIPGSAIVGERVEVPRREVAIIVGRQGRKIKALQEKTDTCITAPARDQHPVFIITGTPKNVNIAKYEVVHAVDKFMQTRASFRASRKENSIESESTKCLQSSEEEEEYITDHVRITTPARDQHPVFIITGTPQNVNIAKYEVVYAVDKFMQTRASFRASRKENSFESESTKCLQSSEEEEEYITDHVRVSPRCVDYLIGRDGAGIKRIEQETWTRIISPRQGTMDPCFKVTGKPDDVEDAKRKIRMYIWRSPSPSESGSDTD